VIKKKIAVVTALMGAYESNLLEFEYDRDKFDFICYTNMTQLKSSTWNIIYVDEAKSVDDARASYYYKWNPHEYLNKRKYDEMVWMDASVSFFNYEEFLALYERWVKSGKLLFIEKHPSRNTLIDEVNANIALNKDDHDNMKSQYKRYIDDGYDESKTIMVETGLSFRKFKDISVVNLSGFIWDEISPLTNTKRDQLVFDYCLQKINFESLGLFSFNDKIKAVQFKDHPNTPNRKEKLLLVGPWFGEKQYEQIWGDIVAKHCETNLYDKVIVGARTLTEEIYRNLPPHEFLFADPDGVKKENTINGIVPTFNVGDYSEYDVVNLTTDYIHDYIGKNKKIHILWSTIRANEFDEKFNIWLSHCKNPERIVPHVLVENEDDISKITSTQNVIYHPSPRKGVCYPSYVLSSNLKAKDDDIVIFASDDFEPIKNWDEKLIKEFTFYDGSLLVDDKVLPKIKDIMALPILTYRTLKKLNYIIYHPAYAHCYSDNELLYNLQEMNLVKDIRNSSDFYFIHNHYANSLREQDDHDKTNSHTNYTGKLLWDIRKQLKLADRLKYDINEPILSIMVLSLYERGDKLHRLLEVLKPQLNDDVELIVVTDDRKFSIGHKRNYALSKATGRYVSFIDDDDMVSDKYVETILKSLSETDVDCCSLNGEITIDGYGPFQFKHSLEYERWYETFIDGKKQYYRSPNHLNVIRREIAQQVGFKDISVGEDHDFSNRLKELITVESTIDDILYYYTADTKK